MKIVKLPKNFKPIFIDWAITTKCYLKCTHCRYQGKKNTPEKGSHKELNKNQALELAKEISKLKPQWILIEGGEPFLRPDLFSIAKILKFDTRPIYIISSGMGFNQDLAKKCQGLGLKLMISIDSAIANTYKKIRIGARLSDAKRAVKIAQKFGILDSINFTLQKLNASIKEIREIGKLANELKVKSINFLGLKPNAGCANNNRFIIDFDKLFAEIVAISKKYKIDVKVDEPFFQPWLINYKCPTINSKLKSQGPIVAEDKAGCIFGEYLFIEPDGTLKPCSFSPLSFKEIGLDLIKKIQNKKNRKGKCGQCKFQLVCGGCRVRTYALTNDWFESDPYCTLC